MLRSTVQRVARRTVVSAKRRKYTTEVSSAEKVTSDMIDALAHSRKHLPSWAASPEEFTRDRLMAISERQTKSMTSPSIEEELHINGEDEFATGSALSVRPGSFIVIRRNYVSTRGIVLGEHVVGGRKRIVILTSEGGVYEFRPEDSVFEIPAIAPRDVAIRCGLQVAPETESQLSARVEAMQRLQNFDRICKAEQILLGRAFAAVLPQLQNNAADEWGVVTLQGVADLVVADPKVSSKSTTLIAVQELLFEEHLTFVADPHNYNNTRTFFVRPQSHRDIINSAIHICRERPLLEAFASRAKPIIEENRRIRQNRQNEEVSSVECPSPWTSDDIVILDYLLQSLQRKRSLQKDAYAMATTIVKALNSQHSEISESVIYETLVDLGRIAPWQDFTSLQRELNLDLRRPESNPIVQRDSEVSKKVDFNLQRQASKTRIGAEDFNTYDDLLDHRRDFQDLPVYVADSVSAEELDDAFSIESVPGEPDKCWLHVHIADPTTFIHPNHTFAQKAHAQRESIYLPHRTWSMLPKELVMGGLSLGTRTAKGMQETAMTFSALFVKSTGERIASKVEPSVIRNIRHYDYDRIDAELDYFTEPMPLLFDGGQSGSITPHKAIPEDDKSAIRDVIHLTNNIVRRNTEALNSMRDSAELSVGPNPLYADLPDLPRAARTYWGTPKIDYRVMPATRQGPGLNSRSAVAQLAILAGQIGSEWARDHGVPVIRRVVPEAIMTATERQNVMRLKEIAKSGGMVLTYEDFIKAGANMPAGLFSTQLREHWVLGIPAETGYAQVTSPLRRYRDLVNHWQLRDTFLRKDQPTFSEAWLQKFCIELNVGNMIRLQYESGSRSFWAFSKILQHWRPDEPVEAQPAPLNELSAMAIKEPVSSVSTNIFHQEVFIRKLGIPAMLDLGTKSATLAVPMRGEEFPVKVKSIQLALKSNLWVERI